MKKLILVTSPPACGKTYISKQLAKALKHVVYLDKDTLICLSHKIFQVAGEEENRSSEFFEEHIRDAEYEAVIALALEAIDYDDIVLINAPFTREIRDSAYMLKLKQRLIQKQAMLVVVWVDTAIEVCKQRMFERNSERDHWKLAHWDEYIETCNFEIPELLSEANAVDDLILFHNSSKEEFTESLKRVVKRIEEE